MSLVFPTNPSNGDEYQGYAYDSTDNVWNRLPNNPEFVRFSETAPSNPQEGTLWFNTTVGKMFVYYNDGTSSQWVSAVGGIAGQSGTEGQMLIHDGTEWVAYDGGSRNLLYNGAMQVHQRGTSATGLGNGDSGYYTADHWRYDEVSGPVFEFTQTVENDGPSGTGLTKSLKMECTTAESSIGDSVGLIMGNRLEGFDAQIMQKGTASAQSLTLSFWVKSNNIGTYVAELYDSHNVRSISAQYTVDSSDTWEKKTITFDGDTTGTFNNDNTFAFALNLWLTAGTVFSSGTLATSWEDTTPANRVVGQTNLASSVGNYWQITGVQLEIGTVATPFEHKSYATELAECQRYYYKSDINIFSTCTNAGLNNSYTDSYSFPVNMRANPTVTVFDNVNGSAGNATWFPGGTVTSVTIEQQRTTHFSFRQSGNSGYNLALYSFTASAEL